jgi:PleD family two-component response regulator
MSTTFANLLVIDDDAKRCLSIVNPLQQWGWYTIEITTTPNDALRKLLNESIDLVIIQAKLAVQNEFLILNQLRQTADLRHTPVIITTTTDELPLLLNVSLLARLTFCHCPLNRTCCNIAL